MKKKSVQSRLIHQSKDRKLSVNLGYFRLKHRLHNLPGWTKTQIIRFLWLSNLFFIHLKPSGPAPKMCWLKILSKFRDNVWSLSELFLRFFFFIFRIFFIYIKVLQIITPLIWGEIDHFHMIHISIQRNCEFSYENSRKIKRSNVPYLARSALKG